MDFVVLVIVIFLQGLKFIERYYHWNLNLHFELFPTDIQFFIQITKNIFKNEVFL